MIELRLLALLALALVFVSSSAAQPKASEPGEARPGEGVPGDNDPRIFPEEILAPSVDWDDPAWVPVYELHSGEKGPGKGAESLQCGGREACESYRTAEAAKTTSTSTTGAPR